jgi:hydrogenase maturation factor
VLIRAGVGLDSTALDLKGDLVVMSTDPITGAAGDAGWYSVHIACNDIATFGADPVALLLTMLLPPGSSEEGLRDLAEGAHRAAVELGIEIAGGHTEVTAAVRTPVLSATSVGRVAASDLVTPAGARAGDVLVLTKGAGIEGTSIVAETFAGELERRGVGEPVLEKARAFRRELSVVRDARVARAFGPSAMHDPTEGGVAGAAFELAAASGLGFVLEEAEVPVRPETRILAEILGFDPLRLISSGALLIAVVPERAGEMAAALGRAGMVAARVGRMLPPGEGRAVRRLSGATEQLTDTPRDELWRLLDKMQPVEMPSTS